MPPVSRPGAAEDELSTAVTFLSQYILGTERTSEIERIIKRMRPPIAALAILLILATGCGESETVDRPPTPLPTLEPTSTPDIGFAVVVTPLKGPKATPTPAPTATAFTPPRGPYIVVLPGSGPPVSTTVTVRGAHLPLSSSVQLGWSPDGKHIPIVRMAGTDAHGKLVARLAIPASPPGSYKVVAMVGGVQYAVAPYSVVSNGDMSVSVSPTGSGEALHIRGRHFVPRLKLLLVAYRMDARGKPVLVGEVRCGAKGKFRVERTVHKLALGQYALRAWSQNGMTAQMAETFFQVVI